jgi:HAD superfamily hydrolase (TIGR01509 family)
MTETLSRRVRGVIFDMDGVLCESEPFICRAATEMFKELYGVDVPAEDFLPFVGTGEARFIGGPAEKHGLDIDIDKAKSRTYKIYLRLIRGRLKPTIGAREFIDWCRRLGLKLAVATSADAVKMRGNLREIDLPPELFDAVVTGEDIARKKPAPDIFVLAATRLGLRPDECLVVEDAVNGVQAAKSAGAKCLGLTTSFAEGELLSAGADWVAPDFASVPEGVLMIK